MKHTKFLAFLMSLGLLISVTGCSAGGNSSEQSSKSSATSGESASTTQSTEATKSDVATSGAENNRGDGATDEEVAFLAEIEKLANSAEKVDKLRKSLLDFEGVSEVLVFKNSDDAKNTENQIYDGDVVVKETYVKVFYDDSESWVAFTIYG